MLSWLCAVWSKFPQFAQVVAIVESAEQTAMAVHSLIRVSLP